MEGHFSNVLITWLWLLENLEINWVKDVKGSLLLPGTLKRSSLVEDQSDDVGREVESFGEWWI